jgi:hypothetical protein
MLDVTRTEIKRLEDKLERVAKKSIPFASRFALNGTAFDARKRAQENIREKMVTRNKFTERSIRVEQTRTLDVRRQAAVVGSVAPYMEDAEFGAVKRKKGKHGVPIPTTVASGEGEGTQPRRRVPRRPNRLQNIRLQDRRGTGMSRRQQIVAQIKQAAQSGQRFVFLDLQRREGVYRVTGGKRAPRIKMIYDLSRPSVVIPKTPTIIPAAIDAARKLPERYRDALRFQLKRLR